MLEKSVFGSLLSITKLLLKIYNLTSKIIKTYYSNLTTDSDGLCNIQAKSGYTPIFAWVIYPTSSMQTYARIQYNPYSGQFFAKTPLISSGIELNVIYVKMELTH